jgi:putative oxidoreductase
LQRLFSTFAGGWPGVGLLFQRLMTGTVLLIYGVIALSNGSQSASFVPSMIGAAAGILLFLGLWTPVAGTVIAAVETWIAFSHTSNPLISITLATLGATLAMIGPGAWSIDARLFGRKHINTA